MEQEGGGMNGDLISREAALKAIRARAEELEKLSISRHEKAISVVVAYECAGIVGDVPAVDAVEVVRCKDCMFSILLRDSDLRYERPWCHYHLGCRVCRCNALIEDEPITVEDDFFCKYGAKDG